MKPSTAITFKPYEYPFFWNYLQMENEEGRVLWNSGHYKNLDDITIQKILKDIRRNESLNYENRKKLEHFLGKTD